MLFLLACLVKKKPVVKSRLWSNALLVALEVSPKSVRVNHLNPVAVSYSIKICRFVLSIVSMICFLLRVMTMLHWRWFYRLWDICLYRLILIVKMKTWIGSAIRRFTLSAKVPLLRQPPACILIRLF